MTNSKEAAEARLQDLIRVIQEQPEGDVRSALLSEAEALLRAVVAFHLEGIRFRAFNVERLMLKGGLPLPAEASEAFADMRRHLEAAGFHTRSHQSPV